MAILNNLYGTKLNKYYVLFNMKLLHMYLKYEQHHTRYSLSVPCTV